MKKLNIRPDTGVYGTYKRISYEPWTALAEFVDNSTQSFYDHREELFNIKYYKGLSIEIEYTEDESCGDIITITDNAFGMDYVDFQRALILDKPPRNTSGRNEFGMGLKAAACWFGNLWSVETTSLGSSFKYKAEIDIDNLVKYKNEEISVIDEPCSPKEHYTIITIKKLNKRIKGKRIEKKINELLSSIYRCDIRTGEIKIYYNGNLLTFNEVKPYVDNEGKEWKKDVDFTIPYKGKDLRVNGFIAIRLPGSVKEAGYTLLRRGRVIIGGPEKNYRPNEVFGPANLFPYQRLYGELNMDMWPVTQAKDGFDWNSEDLEAKFIKKLDEISCDFRKKADEIRVRDKVKSSELKKKLEETFENNKKISNVRIEFTSIAESEELPRSNIDVFEMESAGVGVDIEDNKPLNIKFNYENTKYDFVLFFDDSNYRSEWLKLEEIDKSSNKYKIILNTAHEFFYPFIQKKDFLIVLAKFACALVVSELHAYNIAENGMISPSLIRLTIGRVLEDFTNE